MIVSFSVSNFRSFSKDETFSLVASKRFSGTHEIHTFPIPNTKEKVLATSVLYGANGAGKSNLFKAIRYLRTSALKPRKKNSGTGRESFRFTEEADTPSTFDLRFISENKLYRFGFKVDDQRVTEEWLIEEKGNKEKILYERVTDKSGAVTIEATGFRTSEKKLNALATVGGPQNQTFLATIFTTLDEGDLGVTLTNIHKWLKKLTLVAPHESFAALASNLTEDPSFLEFAGNFLKYSSTGVDHLKVQKQEISEDDLKSFLPEEMASEIMSDILENGNTIIGLSEDTELRVERTEESHYFRVTVQAAHEHQSGKVISLDLKEESDGTRRLLNLIPVLHHLKKDEAVFFVDEIDRSMHPELVWKFLEHFLKSCDGNERQLIVTTHESNLLDLDLLRRDEIWFAEKDAAGSTHLYSLADFNIRKDLEIRKHYLQGRFGAIPFLGNLDRLLTEKV